MRIDHFSRAVGAELPAFVGPQNRNHRHAKAGEQTAAVQRGAQDRRNFARVVSKREKYCAQNHNDSGFDERGPVLQVGAFSRAPNVYEGYDGDDNDRNKSLLYG